MTIIFVYITVGDEQEARKIGRTLIMERLAGCVNIFPSVMSLYQWQGEMAEEMETVLIAKTQAFLFDKLKERVLSLHSYDSPAILEIPIVRVDSAYANWLKQGTSPEPNKKGSIR